MQNRKPHSQKDPQTGHSIFGTILFSLLAVLAVEFLLLTFAVHVTRLGPQLNQNAEDILAMQVDNRSRYLQSIFHDAQELTSLSDAINGLTQQLLDEGEISLSTLDSTSATHCWKPFTSRSSATCTLAGLPRQPSISTTVVPEVNSP